MIIAKSQSDKYLTEISNGAAMIFSNVASDKGGDDGYFSPHEFLCASLAACLDITTRMVLDHKNILYEEINVKVVLDQSDDAETRFVYDIDIIGDIDEKEKDQIIKIVSKCPVRKTLSKKISFVAI